MVKWSLGLEHILMLVFDFWDPFFPNEPSPRLPHNIQCVPLGLMYLNKGCGCRNSCWSSTLHYRQVTKTPTHWKVQIILPTTLGCDMLDPRNAMNISLQNTCIYIHMYIHSPKKFHSLPLIKKNILIQEWTSASNHHVSCYISGRLIWVHHVNLVS